MDFPDWPVHHVRKGPELDDLEEVVLSKKQKKAFRALQNRLRELHIQLVRLEGDGHFAQPKPERTDQWRKKYLNNSGAKMAEMLNYVRPKKCSVVLDLCGAPGGFAWVIANAIKGCRITTVSLYHGPGEYDRRVQLLPHVKIVCTAALGNIFSPDTVHRVAEIGVADMVVADGSVSTNRSWSSQETDNFSLVQQEIRLALRVLRPGGSFLFKVFDCCHSDMALVYLALARVFAQVDFLKPKSSSPMSGEFYWCCTKYNGGVFTHTVLDREEDRELLEEYLEEIGEVLSKRESAVAIASNSRA